MQITIIDVSKPVTQGKYQVIEVTFKNERGETQGKKLVSFANPKVFKDIQKYEKGAVLEVETFKDENGYWQWKSLNEASEGAETTPAQSKPAAGGKVLGSNYETADERAKRQIYIVRQSSISSAIELLSSGAKSPAKVEDVLEVAKKFEAYVFGITEEVGVEPTSDEVE